MMLALPKRLNEKRAKERAALAAKAGCQYRPAVEDCHYLDAAFRPGRGFKPVVRWADEAEAAWTGPIYTKVRDRKLALYHAEIAADELRRYFLMHDHTRYEVVQRDAAAAKRAEEKRVMDLRKALTNDRLALYDALADCYRLIGDLMPGVGHIALPDYKLLNDARVNAALLLEAHREAAEALRNARKEG